MGLKSKLTSDEQTKIFNMLSSGYNSLEISKKMNRDHRTIKKFIDKPIIYQTPKKSMKPKALSPRDCRKIKNIIVKSPHLTSKSIFIKAGLSNIPKSTRNVFLNSISSVKKMKKLPYLTENHKNRRYEWAKSHIKCDFSLIIWSDECRATLDGPDSWCSGWVFENNSSSYKIRRQRVNDWIFFF